MTPARWRAEAALAAIALVWGATFVLVKNALADISTVLFLAIRFSLAAAVLAVLFRAWRWPSSGQERRPTARDLGGGAIAGVFLAGGYLLQTWGLERTTPSKSAFITGLYIPLVPLLAALVHQKRPGGPEIVGVSVATVGMGLLSLDGSSPRISAGDALTLGCAIVFAFHILALDRFSRPGNHPALGLMQVAVAAGIALSTFWWIESPRVAWSTDVAVALGVTSLFATALAFTLQSWAQQYTSATRTALILTLEPVFAWLASFLALGEILTGRALAGAVLILAGILLVEMKPKVREIHPSVQVEAAKR